MKIRIIINFITRDNIHMTVPYDIEQADFYAHKLPDSIDRCLYSEFQIHYPHESLEAFQPIGTRTYKLLSRGQEIWYREI
jgi:hypothetical protein